MAYRISLVEETPVWSGTDPETGEAIFDKEERRASYPYVPQERLEELLADARAKTCDPDSVKVEYIPYTEAEARAKRDKLLEESDWTQTLDAPIDEATRTAYRVYRQALRDVPQQEGFPDTIIWPELPAKTKADPEPVDEAVDLLLSGATGEEETA